jgi:hypothetical protein
MCARHPIGYDISATSVGLVNKTLDAERVGCSLFAQKAL